MKISIITICFNNEKDIKFTLESVVNQKYENIEYIIIDGASTDNTLSIVKKYSQKISKIVSEPDENLYDAINKGIKLATGKIIGLLHAGDKLYDEYVIKDIVDFHLKHSIDISFGHSKILNQDNKTIRINKSPEYKKKIIKKGWMPSHQSIYVERKLFRKYGYYRTDLGGIADYEWFIRYFYANELRIKKMDRYIIKFSLGGISTINYTDRLKFKSRQNILKCWELNNLKAPFGIVYLKLLRKPKQFMVACFHNILKKIDGEIK